MKKNENVKMIFIIVFSFLIGSVATIGILKWTPIIDNLGSTTGNTNIIKNETQIYEKNSLAPAVEKVYDSVALVKSFKKNIEVSTGTAFVYKTDEKYGYLLTNNHVIEGADKVTLVMSDDEEIDAEVLGSDNYLDLAVIRIAKSKVKQIANIGTSENMKLGDTVFVVGSPMGYNFRGSVTSGILSGKDRMVSVSVENSLSDDWIMRVLQIDASINPGNSGGPLLNSNGEVIGVCSLKLVDSKIEGMGFAIPIEYAMSHAKALENKEKIEWPVLGVEMANINNTAILYGNRIHINEKLEEGVVVISVVENTAAAKSDLKKGDVILKINDKEIKNTAFLRYELYQYQAGDTIKITYDRNGHEKTTKVTLGKSLN